MDVLSLACLGLEVSDSDCDYLGLHCGSCQDKGALLSSTLAFIMLGFSCCQPVSFRACCLNPWGAGRLTSEDKHCYYIFILNLLFLEFALFYIQECLDCMYCTT